jgi:hypothetical protein
VTDTPAVDFEFVPPAPERVAARALVLAAVSWRGLVETDAPKKEEEKLRQEILRWLENVGAAGELEPAETNLLSKPVGNLDKKAAVNASWRSEGMVVLAWALGRTTLPPVQTECVPMEVAHAMAFLDDRPQTPLHRLSLRHPFEIERWSNTYLTLHWRIRQFSIKPIPMDFVSFVSTCAWAHLHLNDLEILDGDLAIDGVRIDKLAPNVVKRATSITQERHQAFNWLLGFEKIYSEVSTDT